MQNNYFMTVSGNEIMFRRKIYKQFLKWKESSNGKTALLVDGARRIGKTTIVEEFGRNEYKSFILLDFSIDEDVISYFDLYQSLSILLKPR